MALRKRYALTDKGKAYRFDSIYDAELFQSMYNRRKGLCEVITLDNEKQFLAVYQDVLIDMYPINNYTAFVREPR